MKRYGFYMTRTVDELFDELKIDEDSVSRTNVEDLKGWLHYNVTTDKAFQAKEPASVSVEFQYYKSLADIYFNAVLPQLNEGRPCEVDSVLQGKTLLSFLVEQGFDVCLNTLALSAKQINASVHKVPLLQAAASQAMPVLASAY